MKDCLFPSMFLCLCLCLVFFFSLFLCLYLCLPILCRSLPFQSLFVPHFDFAPLPPPSILLFILYSCRIPSDFTLNFPFSNREGKPRNFTAAFTIEICSSERSDRGTQNLTLPHYILLRAFPAAGMLLE